MQALLTIAVLSLTIFLGTVDSNDFIHDNNAQQSGQSDGIRYFERDWSSAIVEIAGKSLMSGGDTPTKISRMMLGSVNNVIIIGEIGSGKSEALKKIMTELLANDPEYRVKIIDLDRAIPKNLPHDWMPENSEIGIEVLEFINAPDTNREKVVILADNIDRVPFDVNNKMIDYFDLVNNEGIKVVLTTSNQKMTVPTVTSTGIIIEIPELTLQETKEFLTSEWNAKLGSSPKINDYAFATSEILKETPIPRTLEAIKHISDLLVTKNKDVFINENFMSVEEYVKSEVSNPKELFKNLRTTKVNNFELMNKVIGSSVGREPIKDFYGKVALGMIFEPSDSTFRSLSISVQREQLETLRAQIENVGYRQDLKFLKQIDGVTLFQNPLHEKYFAARYIVNEMERGSTSISEIVKSILERPQYSEVIEYIDSALMEPGMSEKFQPIFESIGRDTQKITMVLDTALSSGFDEVSSLLLKHVHSPEKYMEYFQKYNGKFVEIYSRANYKFGMATISEGHETSFRRSDFLLKHNMEKTTRWLIDTQKLARMYSDLIWRPTEWQRYLKDFISAQEKPKLYLFEYAVENIPQNQLTPTFLEEVMYNTIKHGGFENHEILNYLKTKGADPSRINVNGDTLIHMAVKDGNFEALKFVVEELRVQITDTAQKSLLITLLDTNPTNELTPVDFWRKAQYLVGQGDLIIPPSNDPAIVDVRNLKPTLTDVESSAYKLLTRSGDRELLNEIALEIKTTPELLNELSEGVKNYRRNRILAKHKQILNVPEERLTMTEIFLEYRGPNTLSPQEQFSYEATIRSAFQHDINSNTLTPKQARNIMQGFLKNLATAQDFKFMREFFDKIAVQPEMQAAKNLYFSTLDQWHPIEPESHRPELRKHTLENEFALTRKDLYSWGDFPKTSEVNSAQGENVDGNSKGNSALEKFLAGYECSYIFK